MRMSDPLAAYTNSVKEDEQPSVRSAGGAYYFYAGGPWQGFDMALPPVLPPWWSRTRDHVLRSTARGSDLTWMTSLGKVTSKIAARGWKIEDSDKSARRMEQVKQLLLHADGPAGWVQFIYRHLRDYLTTDNGAFVEIARAHKASGSRITGVHHLDSMRCTRTGDPEFPIIYKDRLGVEHVIPEHNLMMFVDMADPSEYYNGVGLCAASRVYPTIYKMFGLETFVAERITGKRPLSIYFVNGVSDDVLKAAVATAEAESDAKGYASYMGALIVTTLLKDKAPEMTEIPLASLPNGFVSKEERDEARLTYANGLGVELQTLQPLSGQGLGTGTQSVVLSEAEQGQGLAAWVSQWEQKSNDKVTPAATTFYLQNKDVRDERARADVALVRAQERDTRINSGEISTEMARQLAADAGDLPEEWLQQDSTREGTLTDTEKPAVEQTGAIVPPGPAAPPANGQERAAPAPSTGRSSLVQRMLARRQEVAA
jgi:hypothetical protein